jgi:hypothetical protein
MGSDSWFQSVTTRRRLSRSSCSQALSEGVYAIIAIWIILAQWLDVNDAQDLVTLET